MVLDCDLSDAFLNMSFFIMVILNFFNSASLLFCSFILILRSKTAETECRSINTYHIEKAVLSIEAATLNPSGVSRVSSSQVPPSLLRDCVETKMGILKIWPVFILEIKLYEIIKQINDLTIRILSGSIILSFFDYLLIFFYKKFWTAHTGPQHLLRRQDDAGKLVHRWPKDFLHVADAVRIQKDE